MPLEFTPPTVFGNAYSTGHMCSVGRYVLIAQPGGLRAPGHLSRRAQECLLFPKAILKVGAAGVPRIEARAGT